MSALTAGLVEKGIMSKPDNPPEGPCEDSDDAEETPSGGVSPAPNPKSPEHSKREHDFRMQELQVRREELVFHRELKLQELKLQSREQELASQMELTKLHLVAKREGLEIPVSMHQSFDVARNIKLVPPFNEREVDRYFVHFERVATSRLA
ncbi:hypothetical protein N1851_003941 [Merluccius polli]|uniref:Uncharacterized protein n=1 Tax=Merluccius polli TaxID=89951 RepID=A0AA47N818_MERPO|nr:hypothetical protein N1851_003941 [Merluccius polli]